MTIWDYIIVGAGSAGCTLANRLSASGKHSVLVLEAGDKDNALALKIPAGISHAKTIEKSDWGYQSQPDPSRNNKTDQWLRGRVLGGSSSINGMMYVRGSVADFDRWAAMGNTGWSAKDMMPLFQSLEGSDKTTAGRGTQGPLKIKTVNGAHSTTDKFVSAVTNAGFPHNPDYNSESQEGVNYAELTQAGKLRCSAAGAFLKPALKRKNLTLLTGALVHKLLIDNSCVTGVRYEQRGRVHQVEARGVILCGGAINSPQLLMLSGIGDAKALSALGIDPIVDCPSVGRNLREHPMITLNYKMKIPTYNPTGGLLQNIKFFLSYITKGQGPISTVFEATAFLKTREEEPLPDVQLHFVPIGLSEKAGYGFVPSPYPAVAVTVNKNYPKSTGQIRLNSANPKDVPLIECRLLEHEEDIATLVRSTHLVRRIMNTSPMVDIVKQEETPGEALTTDEALKAWVSNNTGLAYHPSGTCRMGIDDQAVVTPDLKVRGIDNLWVADASIMPDLISGNTNGLCMVIGEKLGRQLEKNTRETGHDHTAN